MWTQLGHSDFCSRMYRIRMANSNMNTTRPHQRKTLIFSEVIALESVRGISLPGLIRFQKPNSLIILWPAVDGISLETSKNLQLVGELIYNRLATRCFWERCQDLQNTEKMHTVAGGDLLARSTLLCTCFSLMISSEMS